MDSDALSSRGQLSLDFARFASPPASTSGSIAAEPRSSLTLPPRTKTIATPGEYRCRPQDPPPAPLNSCVVRLVRPPSGVALDMATRWTVPHRWQFRTWLEAHRAAHAIMDQVEESRGYVQGGRDNDPHRVHWRVFAGDLLQLWMPRGECIAQWRLFHAPAFVWRHTR